MKKDYERSVKLMNDQLRSYQHQQLNTLHMHLPTTLQYCQGPLSTL